MVVEILKNLWSGYRTNSSDFRHSGRRREPDSERAVAGGSIRGPDEAGDVRERRDRQDLVHHQRVRRHAQAERSERVTEVLQIFLKF